MAFKKTNNDINHQSFNSLLSGTTLTTVLINGNDLFCANVGDSRAVLYRKRKQVNSTSRRMLGNSTPKSESAMQFKQEVEWKNVMKNH